MCGRFALNSTPRRLASHFQLATDQFELFPRYNIAPTQPVIILRQNAHSKERELTHVVWGLIPSWAKDTAIGHRMINARSESAAVKPGFRGAMKYRRCIVPADAFYEWKKPGPGVTGAPGKIKQPYCIHRRDGQPLALAGLWEHWQSADGGEIESCAILTTEANDMMQPLHDRMPVVLAAEDYSRWLDASMQEPAHVLDLLRPCPGDWLAAYPVSTFVNSPRNEGERCAEKVEP